MRAHSSRHLPRPGAVLFDLLMAVMNSLEVWSGAAGNRSLGLAWRDAVTARIRQRTEYRPYEDLVRESAVELGLPRGAAGQLFERWAEMSPWPDATAVHRLAAPYAFVTNCSQRLADLAARRSELAPRFTLSAEEARFYKPDLRVYRDACSRLGFPPERTAFVAGSPYDAQGAHDAGLQSILVVRRDDHRPLGASFPSATTLTEIVTSI